MIVRTSRSWKRQRNRFTPRTFRMELSPADTLILPNVTCIGRLTYRTVINVCFFKFVVIRCHVNRKVMHYPSRILCSIQARNICSALAHASAWNVLVNVLPIFQGSVYIIPLIKNHSILHPLSNFRSYSNNLFSVQSILLFSP